jgi:hypothetical protein
MARPDLHKFEKSLNNNPGLGSTDEPRTIKAKNLDDNNKKLTLLKGEGTPELYEVKYTTDGTRITRIFENGQNPGDLLFWNGSRWAKFAAPTVTDLRVLTITDGTLAWTATEDCG